MILTVQPGRAIREFLKALEGQRGAMADRMVINAEAAAKYLSLSESTLKRWRVEGKGPAWIALDERRVGYDKRDLDDWLKARTRNRVPASALS
jgi:predicted DNA-binding transcriptional regulator AlpA